MVNNLDFECVNGDVAYLVPGNLGRMINAHDTAFRISRLLMETGMFEIEILEEKDMGAFWLIPFEDVRSYRFAKDSRMQPIETCIEIVQTIIKFDKPYTVKIDAAVRGATLKRIKDEAETTRSWLRSQLNTPIDLAPVIGYRLGHPELTALLREYLHGKKLLNMDDKLAANFVHNPYSGELVKAHAIALAELGLAAYRGKIVRDPSVFRGNWSKPKRKAHIIARLAFMQAMWSLVRQQDTMLYRAYGSPTKLIRWRPSFVSSTFSREIAEMLYGSEFFAQKRLLKQTVPPSRLFMTFIETQAMCKQYPEAEALLIAPLTSKEKF